MINSPYMGLAVWNSATDIWDHSELANNFRKIDEHDHANGRGRQIPTGGIEDGAITLDKLSPEASTIADGSVDTRHLRDGAVTNPKLALKSVATENILNDAVTSDKLRDNSVYARKLKDTTQQALGVHRNARRIIRFTPGIPGQSVASGEFAPGPRTGGQTDVAKVVIPPGGGLLHVYAEGSCSWSSLGGEYAAVNGWLSVSADYINLGSSIQFSRGLVARVISKVGSGSIVWRSQPAWSGASTHIVSGALTETTFNMTEANIGAAVTRYIPAGPEGRTVSVKLEVSNGGYSSMVFGEQILAAWTETAPHVAYNTGNAWPEL